MSAGFFALWFMGEWTSLRQLMRKQGFRHALQSLITVFLLLAVIVVAGVISSKPRFDFSKDFTVRK